MLKGLLILQILLMSAILLCQWPVFQKINSFKNFCSNLMEKLFLGVYNDKSDIQVLKSNDIDSNCLFSEKTDFSSNTTWKKYVWQTMYRSDITLTYVSLLSIKLDFYKLKFSKVTELLLLKKVMGVISQYQKKNFNSTLWWTRQHRFSRAFELTLQNLKVRSIAKKPKKKTKKKKWEIPIQHHNSFNFFIT